MIIAILVFLCVCYPLFILSGIIGVLACIVVYPVKYIICGDSNKSFDYAINLTNAIMETPTQKIYNWTERLLGNSNKNMKDEIKQQG